MYVWSKLKDSNVLPLLGYAFDEQTGYPILISQWMAQGDAMKFVQTTNPDPERLFRLVSTLLKVEVSEIVKGLLRLSISLVGWLTFIESPSSIQI